MNKIAIGIVSLICYISTVSSTECSKPPIFVNPRFCCQEPNPTLEVEKCSKLTGFPLVRSNDTNKNPSQPPSEENIVNAACFAECILNESHYIRNGILDMQVITADLQQNYPNDPEYRKVLINAFHVCAPIAQQKMKSFLTSPLIGKFTKGCNPFAGLLFGCVYMEYFQNCPSSKWNPDQRCNDIRKFMKECEKIF